MNYNRVGPGDTDHRRSDPRIAAMVRAALRNATITASVGAGSIEPMDRAVIPSSAPPGCERSALLRLR